MFVLSLFMSLIASTLMVKDFNKYKWFYSDIFENMYIYDNGISHFKVELVLLTGKVTC